MIRPKLHRSDRRTTGVKALLLLLPASLCAAQTPQTDLRALVADSLAFASGSRMPEYEYTIRNHTRVFDSDGKLRKDEETLGIRTRQEGFFVFRIFEKNGKKLSEDESREQEEKVRKRLDELKSASPEERERIRAKEAERNAWVKEVPDAFNFTYAGEEMLDNRKVMVVLCAPRSGYKPQNMRARVLGKLNAKLWIDQADRELVKAEGATFETVSIGMGVLAKIEKGTRFALRRMKLPDGNWVAQSQKFRFAARMMMVKSIHNEISLTMSDFRQIRYNGRSGGAERHAGVHNESFCNSTRRRAGDANGQITSARKGRGQPKAVHAARRVADSRSHGPQVRCESADL